ncbi:MAG: hypothetical protein P4L41_05835 [Flavipsychrobacter sp.]|nr:hypothetical protein [Flavipsychrobacter sp.]
MNRIFYMPILVSLVILSSCGKHNTASPAATVPAQHALGRIAGATVLGAPVAEAKVYKLLPGYGSSDDFEASGVYYLNGYFYVACDNMSKISKIKSTLSINSSSNSLLSTGTPGSGSSNFESITYDNNNTVNWYVTAETEQNGSVYQPRIYEYDASMNYQSRAWADYYFTSATSNKGFEGTAWVFRGGDDYMLGLVEGTGKMPVLKKTSGDWVLVDSITLPSNVTFTDYAEIAIHGNTIAILSQEDSQFWLGTLSSTSWTITGPGKAYEFPTGDINGNVGAGSYVLYANVEGLSFISDTQIVVCSDKAKSSQPSYQTIKDQSVHIFNLN